MSGGSQGWTAGKGGRTVTHGGGPWPWYYCACCAFCARCARCMCCGERGGRERDQALVVALPLPLSLPLTLDLPLALPLDLALGLACLCPSLFRPRGHPPCLLRLLCLHPLHSLHCLPRALTRISSSAIPLTHPCKEWVKRVGKGEGEVTGECE